MKFLLTVKLPEWIWYRAKYAWLCLYPFSGLYRVAVFLKRYFTPVSTPFSVPVIAVGNITVGGTGKSPFVIALIQFLRQQGYTPGVVSRGYGGQRSSCAPLWVTASSVPRQTGDEPLMIARAAACPVVVSVDRVQAVRYLLQQAPQCDVVVSDDGLQHTALWRDITICIVDAKRRFGNQQCLPAGPLREPLSRLKHFDFVLENGVDATSSLKWVPDVFVDVASGTSMSVDFFAGKTVHAVAAIAHPDRFFSTLTTLGVKVIPHVFPDHYFFSEKDFCFKSDLPIVMTEKDAVKCQSFFLAKKAWFLKMNMMLDVSFQDKLIKKLKKFKN